MRFKLDPLSPTGASIVQEIAVQSNRQQSHGYVVNKATGLITAGTNVTITGNGTPESPYSISSSGSGGSVYTVNHGSNNAITRPTNTNPVIWIGSVEPLNALDYDAWIDIS